MLKKILAAALLGITVPAWAEEFKPRIEPASDEAEQTIPRFKLPPGFKVDLFAAEPRLANPVAFSIDEHGKFYVIESFRHHDGVLDIRGIMSWLDDDTACQTVADRLAMTKKHVSAEEYVKMGLASDQVRLIEDRDHDGKADHDSVFTDHDSGNEFGLAAGILAQGDTVYYANLPHLFMLQDKDGDGHAEVKKSLSYGYGVRFNFDGHDLHGLRMGPDRKLYFTMGDRALNVEKSVDGRKVVNTESGSVLRCNPDGTELEIYFTGLRNPQELAFDEHGNLFSGDNNCDAGDAARWVQIVEGGDGGWREGYQSAEFPVARGPWMLEKIWVPQPPDAPIFYRLPPVMDLPVAGPSGLTYAPGTGMPSEWNGRFYLCDFRGGTGSGIWAIKNKPKGASFEVDKIEQFVWQILPTDVEFGYDGGLYWSDWINGWDCTGKGRLYHVHNPAADGDPLVKSTAKIMDEGFAKRSAEELAKLLEHPDQRVRQEAEFALVDLNAVDTLKGVAQKKDATLAQLHAIWGMGIIARTPSGGPKIKNPQNPALSALIDLLQEQNDDEVRAEVVKALGDYSNTVATEYFIPLLADKSPRVRFFAAQAIGRMDQPRAEAMPAVVAMLRENKDQDAYLRHAGVMALTALARHRADALASLSTDESSSVRMGALLAMRRLGRPEIGKFLHDADPNLVLEAARAINDVPIDGAWNELAKMLDDEKLAQKSKRDEFVVMRALNANWKLGTQEAADRLARYASHEGNLVPYRIEALRMLAEWGTWGGRDRIVGVWRTPEKHDVKFAKAAAGPALAAIFKGAPDPVRAAAAKVIGRLGIDDPAVLTQLAGLSNLTPQVRAAAMNALATANDPRAEDAIRKGLTDRDLPVRIAAIKLAMRLSDGVKVLQGVLYNRSAGVPEQQAAIAAIAAAPPAIEASAGSSVDDVLSSELDLLLSGKLRPELQLDVMEAISTRRVPEQRAKLKVYNDARPDATKDELFGFHESLVGGDAEAGKRIFMERADVSCLKCHSINKQGGNAGPDLAGIAKRQPRQYLLESIVLPAKVIAQGFETVIVRTKKGQTIAGVLKSETDAQVVLDVPDKGQVTIEKADIDKRKGGQTAMPPDITKTLSKRDVRDLVEFLSSLK